MKRFNFKKPSPSRVSSLLLGLALGLLPTEWALSAQTEGGLLPEVPSHFCSPQDELCSAAARAITQSYFSGGVPQAEAEEMLYVGSCYILNRNYDASHEHYGYVYLKRENGRYKFDATFAFFFDSNPYEKMTIEQARARASKDSNQWIVEANAHWQADLDVDPPWQHFLRQNASGSVDMIGLWGVDAAVTCRLKRAGF